MTNLDVQEFRSRCLSAILLKHEIGLADHYAAELCEELGLDAPETTPTASELADLANAVLLARADAGAAAFKSAQKAAKKSAKEAAKAPEKKGVPAPKAKPIAKADASEKVESSDKTEEVKAEVKSKDDDKDDDFSKLL